MIIKNLLISNRQSHNDLERIRGHWKSFCNGDNAILLPSFQLLLQTTDIPVLKTLAEIKEMVKDKVSKSSLADCKCNEFQATSPRNKKRLCELLCPSHRWKTSDKRLMDILENYEYSGTIQT